MAYQTDWWILKKCLKVFLRSVAKAYSHRFIQSILYGHTMVFCSWSHWQRNAEFMSRGWSQPNLAMPLSMLWTNLVNFAKVINYNFQSFFSSSSLSSSTSYWLRYPTRSQCKRSCLRWNKIVSAVSSRSANRYGKYLIDNRYAMNQRFFAFTKRLCEERKKI